MPPASTPGSQAAARRARLRPLRPLVPVVHVRARPCGRERDPVSRSRRPARRHRHRRLRLERSERARRAARGGEPCPRPDRGDRADHAAGDRLGRGQALLRPRRDRRARRRASALGRRSEPGHRRGRLDDHAAVRQERLHPERADARTQGARGGARVAARGGVVEGPDPDRVPEHDLLRKRRLRDPASLTRRTSTRARSTSSCTRRRCSPGCRPTRRSTTRSRSRGTPSCGAGTCST